MTNKDYDKRLRDKRITENRCTRCGRPRDSDKKTCSACLKERSDRYRKAVITAWEREKNR